MHSELPIIMRSMTLRTYSRTLFLCQCNVKLHPVRDIHGNTWCKTELMGTQRCPGSTVQLGNIWRRIILHLGHYCVHCFVNPTIEIACTRTKPSPLHVHRFEARPQTALPTFPDTWHPIPKSLLLFHQQCGSCKHLCDLQIKVGHPSCACTLHVQMCNHACAKSWG